MKTLNKPYIPKFKTRELRQAIMEEYQQVACDPDHKIHFTSGYPLAKRLGYPDPVLRQLPEEAIRPFAGVGNPFRIGPLQPYETILDIGSGGGMDCLVASLYNHHSSEIYGLDMTDSMLEKARENARTMALTNVKFVQGYAESIPFEADSMDLVISNGVINLCPDKKKVYQEIFRVLKPGGRFMIADVLLEKPVPNESRDLIHLWTSCVAGGIPKEEYLEIIKGAGFTKVQITHRYDVFEGAKVAKSAAFFGAKGFNLFGCKGRS